MLKTCKVCGIEKDISSFYSGRRDCKDCKNAAARQWRKDNPENVARHRIRHNEYLKERRYKINQLEFDQFLEKQGGKCAICNSKFKNTKDTHIDHCHDSSKVRGLLCNLCNTGLGQFDDNVSYMENAILYLNTQI